MGYHAGLGVAGSGSWVAARIRYPGELNKGAEALVMITVCKALDYR
jgi:hypothetical protein